MEKYGYTFDDEEIRRRNGSVKGIGDQRKEGPGKKRAVKNIDGTGEALKSLPHLALGFGSYAASAALPLAAYSIAKK